jgi:hypothetical protein
VRVAERKPKGQSCGPPLPEGLRLGAGEREDYTYNRTR